MTDSDPRVARTRAAVLEAALHIAAERGFANATIDAISQESKVSRSTIYRHWSDLAAIFLDALESEASSHVAIDTGSLRDDLLHLMLNLTQVLTTHRYGRLLPHLISAAAVDPALADAFATFNQHRQHINQQVLDAATERGELDPDLDPDWIQELLFGPVFYRHLISRQPIDDRWATQHIDNTLALIRSTP